MHTEMKRTQLRARMGKIEYPTTPVERDPRAVVTAKEWADYYVESLRHALKIEQATFSINNVFRAHNNLIDHARIVSGNALKDFLYQRVEKSISRTVESLNERYGLFVTVNENSVYNDVKFTDEISILGRIITTVRYYHLADTEARKKLKESAANGDESTYRSHMKTPIHHEYTKASMKALNRYFELDPELIKQRDNMFFNATDSILDEEVIDRHHFLIAHVLFPENFVKQLNEFKDKAPLRAADNFLSRLKSIFLCALERRDYPQDKPVKLTMKIQADGAIGRIGDLHRIIDLAYRLIGEGNPESHLSEFVEADSEESLKCRNGHSVRVFNSHLSTTITVGTADKMIALLDQTPEDIARMIELMVNVTE